MSSDESIAIGAAEVVTQEIKRGRITAKASKLGPGPTQTKQIINDPDSDDTASSVIQCFLCLKQINEKNYKSLRGCKFHAKCWNATRCYRRMSQGRECIADDRGVHTPDKGRKEVQPLLKDENNPRDGHARAALKSKIMEHDEYQTTETINDQIIMSRKRFRRHMKTEESMPDDEADQEFDMLLEQQSGRHIDGLEEKVAVAMPQKLRIIEGSVNRRKTITESAPAAASSSTCTRTPPPPTTDSSRSAMRRTPFEGIS